jgi:dephospho-CoA kinase
MSIFFIVFFLLELEIYVRLESAFAVQRAHYRGGLDESQVQREVAQQAKRELELLASYPRGPAE